uniref:Smoothelin domain-containing protein n=1 Tax=Cacopsylla melanoneura TaxID=428564 RepID=A0A8D8W4M2_9HEMI
MSSSSYTVDTKKETNKSKRKFSSAQSKEAAKKRVSTPKVSPDTSPTRDGSVSDGSNDSQGTYNTSTKRTQDVTRSDSHDTYNINRSDSHETYSKSTEYKRSDSNETFNKDRRDSSDTYNKDVTTRNDSRNSYIIDNEETQQFERSDSRDSFNVSKLRKDSKDIAKQELKQRRLFSEYDSENVKSSRTNDFIRTEISENIQQGDYKSPSVSPTRQKSPEYSSEGSITREIKLTNSLTDKHLTLIEQSEDKKDTIQTSSSVTPCTSPDSSKSVPRRPSILKKKSTDSHVIQESQTNIIENEKQQQSTDKSRPKSPEKSFTREQQDMHKTTERKSSILKTSSKTEVKKTDTIEGKTSSLKSPVKKEKSPERYGEGRSTLLKEKYEITVTEQNKSPVRPAQSPTRDRKSPSPTKHRKSPSPVRERNSSSPTKGPRQSPTRVVPFESRLTSPTQASLIREQEISETFEITIKDRRSPTKSPSRDIETSRGVSPQKSPVRDTKSPEKNRKSPVRERASPQRTTPKQTEKRPTRKSSIPRAESLRSINKKTTSASPTGPKQPAPKGTPSKTTPQRSLTPQQSRSSIKTTPQKMPVTSRTSSTNISKTSSLVKTNSYTSRRATEPVKQAKSPAPPVVTKIPTKTPVKQAPKATKQPVKKLPVKSPKTSKDIKTNAYAKQTKTSIEIEEEIRASNKALESILTKEQQEYDSEIDSEMPPEEFLVDDEEIYNRTGSTKVTTQTKSYFTNKQDKIRRGPTDQEGSSSSDEEENENITITKAKQIEESSTTKQNEDLLSVVVQLPNSSRESTPGVKNTGAEPVPSYSTDINQPTRYADYYSEPETDNEKPTKPGETHRRYEQVTDLDEETTDVNVSVADRVDKFLKSTRTDVDKETSQSETVIQKKSVSQAKNMFENIAKAQSSPNYNERVTKTHVTPVASRKPVEEDDCKSKTYYEVNNDEKRTINDFINIEKESISIEETQAKKSPKDVYLEKTTTSSTPTQKSTKVQPQKKVFDDTYYIEKNKRKQEEIDRENTTIDSCDEYIEIKEDIDTKKKSPKDIYLERAQKTSVKTNVIEARKKSIPEDKKPEEKVFKRAPSTTFNNTNSKKNFFEEKINIESEKSKQTLKKNKSSDKVVKSDRKSPARQSPNRKSPENGLSKSPVRKSPTRHASPIKKSPVRQSPTRKSPEKVKRKYEGRKDSLAEIRSSNIIAERRSKFSPLKEKSETVIRRQVKNVHSKENIRPSETRTERKSVERKSVERKSQERSVTKTTTTKTTIITDDGQVKITKDRKPSVERKVSRKPSNSKFEERRASFENRSASEKRISSTDKTVVSKKSKSRSPEPKITQDRSSPVRKAPKKSPTPEQQHRPTQKQDSFTNKFGVVPKKTSNTSSTNVTSKTNTAVLKSSNKNTAATDSIFDIESIFDLELLEKMLEKAVGYDQRRRLRAQVREVRRIQEEETRTTRKSTSVSPSRNTNQKKSFIEEQRKEIKSSSKPSQPAKSFTTQTTTTTKQSSTYESKPSAQFEPKPSAVLEKKNSYQRNDTSESVRRGSSEINQQSTYTTSQVREETCTDSITSSYGVGPTDDNGRPLFGLKALRRTNTNKTLGGEDEVTSASSVQITEEESEEFGSFKDSSGRPLFGGLRALKSEMPEQPPTSQLKDLVEKHEKSARLALPWFLRNSHFPNSHRMLYAWHYPYVFTQPGDAAVTPELRRDVPKVKFRRSFILEDEPELPEPEEPKTEDTRSPSAPVSLKSLWLNQAEVKIGADDKDGTTTSSHSTVVSTRTSMKTDSNGRVSVTKDTMAGEISVKDNEEPKGKLVKSEYKFNKANGDDKGKSESKTTTAVLNSKNIKDSNISETFKLTDHNSRSNRFIENEKKGVFRKTDSNSSVSKENQEFANTERRNQKRTDSTTSITSKNNLENEKRFNKTDSSSSFTSSKQIVESSSDKRSSYRKTDSNVSATSKPGDDDEDIESEVRRKPVVRGDSVRALQHKFQQATVSSSMKNAVPAVNNESKAVTTSSNQTNKTVNTSSGTVSTTTTTKSSTTKTETFSTVTKGSSTSYADSEDEDYQDAQGSSSFRNSAVIEDDGIGNSSAALVRRIEKQRMASSTGDRSESRQTLDSSDLELIADESQLRILLEACSDYEGRRKIRARLRDVMAENNDATAVTAKGVYLGEDFESDEDDSKVVNDSGTETSEDQNNTVDSENKEPMTEVQITLSRLEKELDKTNNKENVQGLLNKLKTYLNVKNENNEQEQSIPTPPPRKYHKNRHSVAVTQDDMNAVRGLLNQYKDQDSDKQSNQIKSPPIGNNAVQNKPSFINNGFEKYNDVQHNQTVNLNNSINNNKPVLHFQKDIVDTSRTNNNVGKQTILKQNSIDVQSHRNGNVRQFVKQSSLDSEYSYTVQSPRLDHSNEAHVEHFNPNIKQYTSVQYRPDVYTVESNEHDQPLVATLKLRETNIIDDADDGDISSDDDENNGGSNIRNARKLLKFAKNEMKSKQLVRSSKKIKMKRSNTIDIPKNMKYYSSGDELANDDRNKTKTPSFVPKTENDFKFLAFLRKNNSEDTKCYNSAARGGAHWSNRFSCIKTTFENSEKQNMQAVEPKKSQAKLFWQKSEEKIGKNTKLPWMSNDEHSNVVTGSLVVQTKPKQSFTHAVKSPFQTVNVQSIPQTKTSYTGTVKQMAHEKFNKHDHVENLEPRVVKNVNAKVNHIDHDARRTEIPNTFSSITSTTHRNFVPEQSNFKPVPHRPDSSQNYKPIVQPVYPYQKPQQVPSNANGQTSQFIRKQFPEPQYQSPMTKVISPQQGMQAYNRNYGSPQEFHNKSGVFSPYQDRTPGFNGNSQSFQSDNPAGFYENQISPYEPSVVEIHKSPLCTKNGSHFTPISPAVVDPISYEPQTVAVSRVMGRDQCQQAIIVNKSNKQHFNESTNVLKNIISQHQSYDNSQSPHNQLDEDDSQYPTINTANLPSNTSYVYPTPANRPNITVQPMNYSASSYAAQTVHNYPPVQSPPQNFSYQNFPSQYPPANYQSDSNRFTPHRDDNFYKMSSNPPNNNLNQAPISSGKTRPNSMYMHHDEYNTNMNFSNNPIYSANSAPYALTGSKSSSSIYPSSNSVLSPVHYPYRPNANVSQERNYPSIPSNQFTDSRQKFVTNNVKSFERAMSQPPRNIAVISNAPTQAPRVNVKPSGGESKISYMNYISQISPQTMQNKLNYSPGRKSISPCNNVSATGHGELSQSSTQSSISDMSPINKLNSPHANLSTPSSPQLPAPPILTKTPQLKISSKTAFVPVKPFNQQITSAPSIPKLSLKLPPTSPNTSCISPSAGYMSPPSSSPQMPSVLQKSESWHQMLLDRMAPRKPSPIMSNTGKLLPKAKSSHSLSFAKQFEAAIPDTIEKKKTVEAYLNTGTSSSSKKEINKYNFKQFKKTKTSKSSSSTSKSVVPLSDNLENVDEAFDSLFNSSK